jgi:transporter family protein
MQEGNRIGALVHLCICAFLDPIEDSLWSMTWLPYAFVSAAAAALTAILAKIGVEGVPSTLATAVRTVVVTAFAWLIALSLNEHRAVTSVSRRSWLFLLLSGVATGVSWLAYFRALQLAPASRVAPIDKLSLPLTIVLAGLWLGEPIGARVAVGVALMTVGALLTLG